jgi:nucleotide-binding universal stress UspA family protein
MIRSILVPLDGFGFGEHALPMALSLARRARTPLRLVHVLQPFVEVVPELAAYQGPMETEYREEKQKYLDGVIRRLREVSDVKVTAELLDGAVVPTIRQASETADLVVMTTHGRGPLARFWLGSVADQLVRELNVPMLLMHPGKEPADFSREPTFRHILLPLDGTSLSEQIVIPAVKLAKLMDAQFRLMRVIRTELPADFGYQYRGGYVSTQAREMVAELEAIQKRQERDADNYLFRVSERIRATGVATESRVILDESPTEAILHEATKGIDMVALATHGFGGLKRIWLGSVADKVIRGSTVPVLVLRPKK